MIKLKITRTEENSNYEEELKLFLENENRKRNNDYGYRTDILNLEKPEREFIKDVLEVSIEEKQFEAIRKSVIDLF